MRKNASPRAARQLRAIGRRARFLAPAAALALPGWCGGAQAATWTCVSIEYHDEAKKMPMLALWAPTFITRDTEANSPQQYWINYINYYNMFRSPYRDDACTTGPNKLQENMLDRAAVRGFRAVMLNWSWNGMVEPATTSTTPARSR